MDTWFRKKSLVDTIFKTGHWNERLATMYAADLALHGGGASSPAAVTTEEAQRRAQHRHAFKLRRNALFWRNKMRKAELASRTPGECANCGWSEQDCRIQCWVCKRLVCTFCQVTNHVLCHRCKDLCREEFDGYHYLEPPELPLHSCTDHCESCHTPTTPGDAGASRVAPATGELQECYLCHRWLCVACRLDQTPAHCVVCPVERAKNKGHTGLSLRVPRSTPTPDMVEDLTRRADQATAAIGRAKFSSGAFGREARLGSIGRAHRVGMAYAYATAYATEGGSSASGTRS